MKKEVFMNFLIPSLSLILLVPVLLFSSDAALALPKAFDVIARVVLAGIFPTGVLLKVFLFSDIGEKLTRTLEKTRLFKKAGLSGNGILVVAGQLCGLPMGACLLSGQRECENALALSSLPSLAFLMAIHKNGFYIWLISALVVWNVTLLLPSPPKKSPMPHKRVSFGKALEEGVVSSIQISGAIIFFSIIVSFIPSSCPEILRQVLCALLEMGTAAQECTYPTTLALALSFSGLSALLQIHYLSGGIRLMRYVISKFFIFPFILIVLLFENSAFFVTLVLIFLLTVQINAPKLLKKRRVWRIIKE